MAVGVASVLGFVGIILGIFGVVLGDVLLLFLAVALFGIGLITVDSELSELCTRFNALGGGSPRGWAPTCPSCGLDILGSEAVCPHCGKPVAATSHSVP